jgi:hypothetical protein
VVDGDIQVTYIKRAGGTFLPALTTTGVNMNNYSRLAVTACRKYEVFFHNTSHDVAVVCPVTGLCVKGTPEFPRFVVSQSGDTMMDLETGKCQGLLWVTDFNTVEEDLDIQVRHHEVDAPQRLLGLLKSIAPLWMTKRHLASALGMSLSEVNDVLAAAVELAGDALESRCLFPAMPDYRYNPTH